MTGRRGRARAPEREGGRLRSAGPVRLMAAGLLLAGCVGEAPEGAASLGEAGRRDTVAAGTPTSEVRPPAEDHPLTRGDTLPGHPGWTAEDRAVLLETLAWSREHGIGGLPMGERVARIAERFVGAPYVPRTLDPPGPERLVVNLRAFDCVTLVESVLTLARVAGEAEGAEVAPETEPGRWMDRYATLLEELRYRGGLREGYPSRLHYFSEWIADAEAKGWVRAVTAELGGEVDPEPLDFMTAHREAYTQLADPEVYAAVEAVEMRLGERVRHRIPEGAVAEVADGIREGDVIAATSTLAGLDVAHTGIAVRREGRVHLLHAPLVGDSVQVSPVPLAERLQRIATQDGIMVARPLATNPE